MEPAEVADVAVPVAEVQPVEAGMEELAAEEQPVVIEVEAEAPAAVEDDWSEFTIEEEEVEEKWRRFLLQTIFGKYLSLLPQGRFPD